MSIPGIKRPKSSPTGQMRRATWSIAGLAIGSEMVVSEGSDLSLSRTLSHDGSDLHVCLCPRRSSRLPPAAPATRSGQIRNRLVPLTNSPRLAVSEGSGRSLCEASLHACHHLGVTCGVPLAPAPSGVGSAFSAVWSLIMSPRISPFGPQPLNVPCGVGLFSHNESKDKPFSSATHAA